MSNYLEFCTIELKQEIMHSKWGGLKVTGVQGRGDKHVNMMVFIDCELSSRFMYLFVVVRDSHDLLV